MVLEITDMLLHQNICFEQVQFLMLISIKIIKWLIWSKDYKEMFLELSLVHKLTFQVKRHLLLNFFLIYLVSWTLSLQEKLAKMIKKTQQI